MLNIIWIYFIWCPADLKNLYLQAGVENKPTVFLFNDIQAIEEGFFEDINNILSSGEVPNLYKPEEFEEVCHCTALLFLMFFAQSNRHNFAFILKVSLELEQKYKI